MKKTLLLLVIMAFAFMTKAQDITPTSEENRFNMTVTLNSDIFFGFYPFFSGSYGLTESSAFTFYGILWSGGTGGNWGNWTEFGVGMNFAPLNGLNINPQIGILNGSLTSGLGTPVFAEGIVPNLTATFNSEIFESEIYGGYYLGFDHGNPTTNNYLHYWLNGGLKFNSFVSAGLHLEHLRFMGGQVFSERIESGSTPDHSPYDYYLVLGPYLQFSDPSGNLFARFTAAGDLRSDSQVIASGYDASSFFKLTVGYSF